MPSSRTVQTIGDKVGKYLNTTNWVDAVNVLGPLAGAGTTPYGSLHTGKYDTDDAFRLVQFDSSLGTAGDYKPLSPLENVPG